MVERLKGNEHGRDTRAFCALAGLGEPPPLRCTVVRKGQPARPTMARDLLLGVGDDIAALRSHALAGTTFTHAQQRPRSTY